MAHLLMNLRDVPDDEADEVRALLEARGIAWYETQPSFWGVSAGGLWLPDESRREEATAALAAYQAERGRAAREDRARDLAAGRLGGAWSGLRRHPVQALAALAGIVLVVALTVLPFVLLHD